MMQLTTIDCPRCYKKCSALEFWHQIEGNYFHLCSDCCQLKVMKQDDLLRIGFYYGFEKAKDEFKKVTNSLKHREA